MSSGIQVHAFNLRIPGRRCAEDEGIRKPVCNRVNNIGEVSVVLDCSKNFGSLNVYHVRLEHDIQVWLVCWLFLLEKHNKNNMLKASLVFLKNLKPLL